MDFLKIKFNNYDVIFAFECIYYLNNKKELLQYTFGQKAGDTYGVTIGDLDGDAYPDIVTANSGGWNIIYYNQPSK